MRVTSFPTFSATALLLLLLLVDLIAANFVPSYAGLTLERVAYPDATVLSHAKADAKYLSVAFSVWGEAHGKEYENGEERWYRQSVFLASMQQVVEHNAKPDVTFKMAMTQFADLTGREFERRYARVLAISNEDCSATSSSSSGLRGAEEDYDSLPKAFDWREQDVVTPVKNQGSCGSCWAFSTTGAIEAHWKRVTGKALDLAEQQLVDCAQNYDNHGCSGGLPSHAFQYIHDVGGIEGEESYPYHAKDETCKFDKKRVVATLAGSVNVTRGDERELQRAVAKHGPVSIAFQVVSDFRLYSSGVYTSSTCGNTPQDVNHAVLAVGYGVDENRVPYWIVKNSWGTTFGEDGYFKIRRGVNMCGVAVCNSYPIVTGDTTTESAVVPPSPPVTTDIDSEVVIAVE